MKILFFLIILVVLVIIFTKKKKINSDEVNLSKQDLKENSYKIKKFEAKQLKLKRKYSSFINLNDGKPPLINKLRNQYKNKSIKSLVDLYYELLGKINNERTKKDYNKMIMYAQMSLGLIEPLIISNKEQYGAFNITSIPAFEFSLPHYAVKGLKEQIKNIEEIVDSFPELLPWKEEIKRAKEMNKIATNLYKHIKMNPGTLQKNLKKEIAYDDGNLISNTLYYMQLNNKIKKEKYSNTNKLFVIENPKQIIEAV